jgi:flagellar M-ring protein FliF
VQSLLSLWAGLDLRRRLVVAAATLGMFAAVLGVAQMARSPNMALLYAGLDPSAAGDVVRVLDQRRQPYSVRGDSIYVPAEARDELRMLLAGEGLPSNGAAGYELLDGLSGFGTTTQMFDAAYLRAKEGELARTIVSSPLVRGARVHIAQASAQPFRRDQRTTASVTITPARGNVPPGLARALKYMVASAVAGLSPEDVAVIDANSGMVISAEDEASPLRQADDRAAETRRNLERLLGARVGPGRALVEVSMELVNERESIRERRFDPDSRVAISTESEQRSSNATGESAGVTVASNLPEGDTGPGNATQSSAQHSSERVNYEVSETTRELQRAPGAIKRMTVAVLVDGVRDADGNWQPRSDAELADLRDLIASAAGIDIDRGDQITIKSMQLELPGVEGTLAETGWAESLDAMSLIRLGIIALVALILGLFVVRPILLGRSRASDDADAAALALPGARDGMRTIAIEDGAVPALEGDRGVVGLAPIDEADATERHANEPVERLRRLIQNRREETLVILRAWMEEGEGVR